MKPLFLVSCAKTKQLGTHPAEELYASPLFKKSVAWVKQQLQAGDAWLILSAKHGALYPDEPIEAYEQSLESMTRPQRQVWAGRVVLGCLFDFCGWGQCKRVVFLAGALYQAPLRVALSGSFDDLTFEDPLSGMEIGQRLQWLTANTKPGARGRRMNRCKHFNRHQRLTLDASEPAFWVCVDCGATSDDGDGLAKIVFTVVMVFVAALTVVTILLMGAP